jgi:hypothetical protein
VCFGPSGNNQTAAPSGETFADVCTGTLYSCGLSTAGAISCWGDNTHSELAHPNASSGERFASLSCGAKYACAVRVAEQGGRATCWGLNDGGRAAPSTAMSTVAVSAAVMHTCSVIRDAPGLELPCMQRYVCVGDDIVGQSAVPCQPGTFVSPASEGGACAPCHVGSFQASVRQTSCDVCAVGSYSGAGAERCSPCEVGHFCRNRTMAMCAPGSSASSEGMVRDHWAALRRVHLHNSSVVY